MDNPGSFPVDVVITWVDTTDEAWIKRYENTLKKPFKRSERWSPECAPPDAELSLCLKLIRKNMKWVRNVFIVTQQQTPECITKNEILIDHSEMGLGLVFNALAIEPSLHKIPGLSEHFLYFNDDFYVVREVTRDLFFTDEGKTVIQLLEQFYGTNNIWNKTIKRTLKLYNSDNLNLIHPHTPYPLTKTQINEAERQFPELWEKSRNALLRGSKKEIHPIMSTYVTSLKNSTAIQDKTCNLKYVYSAYPIDIRMFTHWFNICPPHVVCINWFNTTKKELYDSIEKTPSLYIKLALYLIIILIVVIAIYKYKYISKK